MLNELEHIVITDKYSILYDINPKFIKESEKYDDITPDELKEYCEYRSNYKTLSISEYRDNINNLIREYQRIISSEELKKIIEEFPKRKNGQFHKRTITLAKSCNAIPDKERGFGYIHGQIVAKYKANRKLEVKYIKSYSVV